MRLRTKGKSPCAKNNDSPCKVSKKAKPAPLFVYQFQRKEPASSLWIVFSPWGISKQEPVVQDVVINIAPAVQVVVITLLGEQSVVTAEANGNITITSSSSPTYVRADGKQANQEKMKSPAGFWLAGDFLFMFGGTLVIVYSCFRLLFSRKKSSQMANPRTTIPIPP